MPTGNLPASGKALWERVYEDAKKSSTCKDAGDRKDECAARVAWTAVKNAGWKKDADGNWHKSSFTEFSLRIERASYDKATNERRWRAVASDTDEDSREDSMSLELFSDFINRIQTGESVPEEYRSDFWKGGMPYLSVSHYPDFNGEGVPGVVDAVYIDGNYLKSKGRFHDTALGRKCFEAICTDLYSTASEAQDKVRVSIAFLDWAHKHKSNGYVFEREDNEDICPECLKEIIRGERQGKVFLKGHLVHLAMTRVPVNKRTEMEVDKSMADIKTRKDDAASIVGDELAEELEEKAKLVGKSEVLVIRSDGDEESGTNSVSSTVKVEEAKTVTCKACGEKVVPTPEGTCPKCGEKIDEDGEVETTTKKKASEVEESEIEELVEEATKTEGGTSYPSSDYLVVEDPEKPSTWHLQVKKHGKPDHGLMGAAKAALTSPGGHRGNKYQGPNKAEATAKLKRLYSSEKMTWESEIEESQEGAILTKELVDQLISTIKSAISEEIQVVVKPVEPNPHPLDVAFANFKSAFDSLSAVDGGESEKLHAIQVPFNELGQSIVDLIKSTTKTPEPEIVASAAPAVPGDVASTIAKAITDAMTPIAQKLDMVSAQLQSRSEDRIPQRKGIQLSQTQTEQSTVSQSTTPKLRAIIEKTTR